MKPRIPSCDPGAVYVSRKGTRFCVWAPHAERLLVEWHPARKTRPERHEMKSLPNGYFVLELKRAKPGDHYAYMFPDGRRRPDPASRFQPKDVHGLSKITDPQVYRWKDRAWKGMGIESFVIYELHIGTFTPRGTFASAIAKLDHLKRLGVTCVEIMPVHQFPGNHNWGYDGVGLYAVQNSYGGPEGLKALVDACHARGIAVCLDVVYNHWGPEGNYLAEFGDYFTDKHHTPWGKAVNFDDRHSEHVREFVLRNAEYWVREFHIDALRLDAVHAIFDDSRKHILVEIASRVHALGKKLGRKTTVIAETDANARHLVLPKNKNGYGLDAQWADDFHHAVHVQCTRENAGYYMDYTGIAEIAKAMQDGFVYEGQWSHYRRRKRGTSAKGLSPASFVFCIQNHDQIGNRPFGDRWVSQLSLEAQEAYAAVLLLDPHTPLLFMGQEYGETVPFQYFVDHGDPHLVRAVREGRQREFSAFGWKNIPDPQSSGTFEASKLEWKHAQSPFGRQVIEWYKKLIAFRKTKAFRALRRGKYHVHFNRDSESIQFQWRFQKETWNVLINLSNHPAGFDLPCAKAPGIEFSNLPFHMVGCRGFLPPYGVAVLHSFLG